MKKIIILIVFTITLFSCIEKFDLQLADAEPRLVVDGLITNKPGPYYLQLTLSKVGDISNQRNNSSEMVHPVDNAIVVVSDNNGQIDTLEYIEWDETEYKYDYLTGWSVKEITDQSGGIIGKIVITDPFEYNKRGFYKSSHLNGIPESTYFLHIVHNGKEYNASVYMPPVPDIDSIGYLFKKSEIIGKSNYYVPLLYFTDNQSTKDYYLIQLQNDIFTHSGYGASSWQFSILSDAFLDPDIKGLNVSIGSSPKGKDFYPYYSDGDSIYIALSSLTKEGYAYYQNLLDQFENDGGAYKASPASPPSNISNGGLGFFRASAVSEKTIKIQDK